MPKKRFTSQYSKPPSTVHPSLSSVTASSSSSNHHDAAPTVNDLISSLRKSNVSSTPAAAPVTTPTLPPQIRHLLSQPETPAPRSRDRRRYDENGRLRPAGPPPPRSWLEGSRDIAHLPGLGLDGANGKSRKLQDMCLRTMAKEWEFVREYEKNNLADLPTRLRMLLLSNIAVYGPEDGVGCEGLNNFLMPPIEDESMGRDARENNDGFFRLDLSGSVGRSISFKQLIELAQRPTTPPPADDDTVEFSWEESISRSLTPPIPRLTHLSLSHPPSTISWPRLLAFTKHVPTLTHLSLAYWPVPSLTPNSKTTVMSSGIGKDIQYGGTSFYSHSLENDFREAATVLRRLANRLYGLEYLDVTGCTDWLQALIWNGAGDEGVDWGHQWVKMVTLKAQSGKSPALTEATEYWEVVRFTETVKKMVMLRKALARRLQRGRWIEVESDEVQGYEGLWKGADGEDERRKRRLLESVLERVWMKREVEVFDGVVDGMQVAGGEVERSVWDQ